MSETKLSFHRRHYPVRVKLSAVRDRIIKELDYAEVLNKYGLSPSTFQGWLTKYKSRVLHEEHLKRLSSYVPKSFLPMSDKEQNEVESLRAELERQKLLNEAYELMLELAKERLKIDVKKNYEEMLLAGLLNDKKQPKVKR